MTVSITRQSNLSFGQLQSQYLWRNHPIITTDSHPNWPDIHDGVDFIEFMKKLPDMMSAEPCNFASNLLAKSTTVKKLIQQAERLKLDEKWFFHFRNCRFESVKASRAIIPYNQRPHFLSNHLPPFRSSWILVSHQYEMTPTADIGSDFDIRVMKQLNVRDLVIVMQLQGEIYGRLAVNAICSNKCADHSIRLVAGQSIVFTARFWNFFYEPVAAADDAVTFITEYEWD